MNFSLALRRLDKGERVRRATWDEGAFVSSEESGEDPVPYLKLSTDDEGVEWVPSQRDLFAKNWRVFSQMNFSQASKLLFQGEKIRRSIWDEGIFVSSDSPEGTTLDLQIDLFASDWEILGDEL